MDNPETQETLRTRHETKTKKKNKINKHKTNKQTNKKTTKNTPEKNKKINNKDPTKNSEVNSSDREGKEVPVSYKIPTGLKSLNIFFSLS